MRKYAALGLILCLGLPVFPADKKTSHSTSGRATSTKTTSTKTASTKTKKKATSRKASKTSTRKAASGKSKAPAAGASAEKISSRKKKSASKRGTTVSRKPQQSWRTRQTAPTPDRYREIQQALIDKGFLQGEPTGIWGPDCTEGLKKFQKNQNLEASGKLDSLTLISLGLGPRREPLSSNGVDKTPPAAGAREPQ